MRVNLLREQRQLDRNFFPPHPFRWAEQAKRREERYGRQFRGRGLLLPAFALIFAFLEVLSPVQFFCGRRRDFQRATMPQNSRRARRVDAVIFSSWCLEITALAVIQLGLGW